MIFFSKQQGISPVQSGAKAILGKQAAIPYLSPESGMFEHFGLTAFLVFDYVQTYLQGSFVFILPIHDHREERSGIDIL